MEDPILSSYIEQALAEAVYDKLDDGSFAGKIPPCTGVLAFASTLIECEHELRSILEEWILLGLKLGHLLPIVAGIDLNQKPSYEPVDAL
jgi:predicted RNase H-like HicB family nuclease